jgi:hypothetical protein
MPNTYTLIASNTVSTAVSSITFSSIPATYTDLLLKVSARGATGTTPDLNLQFNSSSSGYTARRLEGSGSAASSNTYTTSGYLGLGVTNAAAQTSNTFSNQEIYIPNYASANYKSVSVDGVMENNATAATTTLLAGLWSNTAAITAIALFIEGGANFATYSTFYLYGISKT